MTSINNLAWFSFILEPDSIGFSYKMIYFLQKLKFKNFILSPEIYSNRNDSNLNLLKIELKKLLDLFDSNKDISFKGISWDYIKIVDNKCEKTILDKAWKYYKM